MLFSYVLLCNFFPVDSSYAYTLSLLNETVSIQEIILIIWIVGITLDEIKQVILLYNWLLNRINLSLFDLSSTQVKIRY